MPLITPNINPSQGEELFQEEKLSYDLTGERSAKINEILWDSSIPRERLTDPKEKDNEFRNILNKTGASVENASRTISQIMHSGKYEHSKLRAAEMVLDLHGIRDKDGKVRAQPIFQFFIKDSAVNISPVFSPIRSETRALSSLSDQKDFENDFEDDFEDCNRNSNEID